MASIPKSAWIQLYKDLQRAALQFPQYSYRAFFKRRIRDHFAATAASKNLTEEEFFKKEQELLKVIRRQAAISHLYPTSRLVIEGDEETS